MEETLRQLRAKQTELMRMREAISELRSGAAIEDDDDDDDDEEEEEEEEEDEEEDEEEVTSIKKEKSKYGDAEDDHVLVFMTRR